MSSQNKNEYAKSVCFFLVELIRTRKIGLKRAAEIADRVVSNINLVDTEADFLRLVKTISSDFEEVARLEERIYMSIHVNKRKELETRVREFVVVIMLQDMKLALDVLQEAIRDEVSVDDLCLKFPQFKQFITTTQ